MRSTPSARLWFFASETPPRLTERRAAALPECRRSVAVELAVTVPTEDVGGSRSAGGRRAVELIGVERLSCPTLKVVASPVVPAGHVGLRHQAENRQCLRRQLATGNDPARKLRARCGVRVTRRDRRCSRRSRRGRRARSGRSAPTTVGTRPGRCGCPGSRRRKTTCSA